VNAVELAVSVRHGGGDDDATRRDVTTTTGLDCLINPVARVPRTQIITGMMLLILANPTAVIV